MALLSIAVLMLALGSGLWLFSLLAQRRRFQAWEAERSARSQQAKRDLANARVQVAAGMVARGPEQASDGRTEAMCGRRTADDRGVQSQRRTVDCGADLALAQSSLNTAASILHSSNDHHHRAPDPDCGPSHHDTGTTWDNGCHHTPTGTH